MSLSKSYPIENQTPYMYNTKNRLWSSFDLYMHAKPGSYTKIKSLVLMCLCEAVLRKWNNLCIHLKRDIM